MARRGPGLSETSTDEAQQALRAYHQALGSFVSAFAMTEQLLQLTLRLFAGLENKIGSALLSGVRPDQAKDLLNRVLDVRNMGPVKGMLKRHFDHLGLITKVRNDILHYGAEFETPEVLIVSNERDAHVPSRLREIRITPSSLRQMNLDLGTIRCGLLAAVEEIIPSDRDYKWREHAREPWRYKPPPQGTLGQTGQKNRPKRSPRPPAFHG